jgi:cell division cycle 14
MQRDKSKPICIIKDQLYWVSSEQPPRGVGRAFFFNIDSDLKYFPFFKDFGPLNLAQTYRFVTELSKLLNNKEYANCPIYHHTDVHPSKKANAAYLMGAFQVLVMNKTAEEAYKPFEKIKFKPFRDALYLPCSYKCTILHCLQGLEFAVKAGWFSLKTFDVRDYEFYERVENGDLNWIIPGKFLAFCTPRD